MALLAQQIESHNISLETAIDNQIAENQKQIEYYNQTINQNQ